MAQIRSVNFSRSVELDCVVNLRSCPFHLTMEIKLSEKCEFSRPRLFRLLEFEIESQRSDFNDHFLGVVFQG